MVAKKDLVAQESYAAKALGYPTGDVYYVNSTSGNAGNDGLSRQHPVISIARAFALAAAGDTIVCEPGGSESVSASIAIDKPGVAIVCPVKIAQQGYEVTGLGSLDLMTISAADVRIEGLRFTRTAGAGGATAGILTTAAADRLHVKACAFDYTALSSAWTNFGVEITNDCDDVTIEGCSFLDCHRGVVFDTATGTDCKRSRVLGCTFFVGQSTAFGWLAAPAGTGTVAGAVIKDCLFVEADGSGAVATDTWDGSDNTDATIGPISASAAVDQLLVTDCRAHTALAQSFNTLSAVNAGAASTFANNATAVGADATAAVTSVGVVASTAASAAVVAEASASSALSGVTSYGLVGSTANSSSLSAVTSAGLIGSSGLSATTSYGLVGSTANSSSLSAVTSAGLIGSSGLSATTSYGLVGSTANSSSLSAVTSAGLIGSSGLSATTSYGLAGSTANSSSLSATTSYGLAGSTANSTSLAAVQAIGRAVGVAGSMADTAIDNNTQSAGCLMATAAGDVLITEVALAKDGTLLAGPTNVEVSSDNAYGLTGTNKPHAVEAITLLQANENVACTAATGTAMAPFVLESGKKLYLHGDDSAGSSGGNTRFAVYGTALSAGGSLS